MAIERQKTFGETVGLETFVPVERLPYDLIECEDGKVLCHSDVHYDARGRAYSSEDNARDGNNELLKGVLDSINQGCIEYTDGSNNTDYADGYSYIVNEVSHAWNDRVSDWLGDDTPFDNELRKRIVDEMCNTIDDWEPEYSASEYARCSGPGCCLYSLEIGEYEEQVDISCHEDLTYLDDAGVLEECLEWADKEDHTYCIYGNTRYVWKDGKNGKAGGGAGVHDGYVKSGNFTFYPHTSGQWHYVVPEDSMQQHLTNAIINLCQN